MKFEDEILSLATLDMKEKRDKLDEKHKRSKEKSTGEAGNASGADGLSGNGQGADSDQLGTRIRQRRQDHEPAAHLSVAQKQKSELG